MNLEAYDKLLTAEKRKELTKQVVSDIYPHLKERTNEKTNRVGGVGVKPN